MKTLKLLTYFTLIFGLGHFSFAIENENSISFSQDAFTSVQDSSMFKATQTWFSLNWNPQVISYPLVISGNIEAGINTQGLGYINPRELYWSKSFASSNLSIGRKLNFYSHLDQEFNLGIWEPRFLWNYFQFERRGLTGLFFQNNQSDWSFNVFGSPISIPDQMPPIRISNGKYERLNPWAAELPNTASFINKNANLEYQNEMPPLRDLVLKPSLIGQITKNPSSSGFYAQSTFGVKGKNQPTVDINGNAYLAEQSHQQDIFKITIHPRVFHQGLLSFDLGQDSKNFRAWSSFVYEKPLQQTPHQNAVLYPIYEDMQLASGLLGVRLFSQTWLSLGHLVRQNGDIKMAGSAAHLLQQNLPVWQSDIPYKNASKLGVDSKFKLPSFVRQGKIQGFFLYDHHFQGAFSQFSLSVQPTESVVYNIGLEMIGSNNLNADSFFNTFKENDRAYFSVEMVL